jgi:hypothetical protein
VPGYATQRDLLQICGKSVQQTGGLPPWRGGSGGEAALDLLRCMRDGDAWLASIGGVIGPMNTRSAGRLG